MPMLAQMYPFGGINTLGSNLLFLCDKCQNQNLGVYAVNRPKGLLDVVRDIKSFHDKGVIDDEAYHYLIRYLLSIYIQGEVEKGITQRIDKALCKKLSPHNLLEALV